jgi:uncharacterized protein
MSRRRARKAMSLDELDVYLSSDDSPPGTSMAVSDLDGFLTGLIVAPEFIHPEEWMHKVFGGPPPMGFEHDLGTAAIRAIVDRHNDISRTLADAPQSFAPIYWHTEDGAVIAADWAEGLRDAIRLRPTLWAPLFDSPEHRHLMLPIAVHWSNELDGSSLLGVPPDQERQILAEAYHHIPEAVVAIREFFMPARVAASKAEDQSWPARKPR